MEFFRGSRFLGSFSACWGEWAVADGRAATSGEDRVAEADRHVARGERIVAQQQRVFEQAVRHADLRMVVASERLLFNFETNLVLARERRRIENEIRERRASGRSSAAG